MRLSGLSVVLAAAAMAYFASPAEATPGDLDQTFGRGGIGTDEGPGGPLATQPDGSILTAERATVRRYTPAGKPDPTFGDGGVASLEQTPLALAQAITVQPDGRVVVAGSAHNQNAGIVVARLLADGTLDPSFGDGSGAIKVGQGDLVTFGGITVDGDGRIAVTGLFLPDPPPASVSSYNLTLARLTADGQPDPTFSDDGLATIQEPGCVGSLGGIRALADRSLVVEAGIADYCPDEDLQLIRVTASGELDNLFGSDGVARFDLGAAQGAGGIEVQQSGRIIALAGGCDYEPCERLLAVDDNGKLDPSFGVSGVLDPGQISGFALGPADEIVTTGWTKAHKTGYDTVTSRRSANGVADPGFGLNGSVVHDLRFRDDVPGPPVVDAQGRIILATGFDQAHDLARLESADEPGDLDADGVRDERDGCPGESGTHHGCPLIKRELRLDPGVVLGGEILSRTSACAVNQRVTVFKARPGPDLVVETVRTNLTGKWQLSHPVHGRIYAAVARTYGRPWALCSGYRSEIENWPKSPVERVPA